MGDRKVLTLRRTVVGFEWVGFAGAYLVLLVLPEKLADPYALLVLVLAAMAILLSILCGAVLVVRYRKFFVQWRGVAALVAVLTLGRWLTARSLLSGRAEPFVSVLTIDTMLILGVSLALALFRHDAGLPFVGWLVVVIVWAALIANRVQGNVIELYLRSVGTTTGYPLWWLDPLVCVLWWAVPLGALSFIWHTLRLIRKEIRGT